MLSFLGSSEFLEDFIPAKVLSSFPKKRKYGVCDLTALNGTQLVCVGLELNWLLRGDFICNHIQAVKNLGPSEVVRTLCRNSF